MPDQPFQPQRPLDDTDEIPQQRTRDVIQEALDKQALKRGERPPAVLTDTIPKIPRQPKPAQQRKLKRRR